MLLPEGCHHMLDTLEKMEQRYEELVGLVSQPDLIGDRKEWQRLVKEQVKLAEVVEKFRQYKVVAADIGSAEEMLRETQDPETRNWLRGELQSLQRVKADLENCLRELLVPCDERDEKNVIMEIRAGAGGEEAALFAGDLFRMYDRFAERQEWSVEVLSASPTDIGGFKEIIFSVEGKGAFSKLKFESGVHRVQRVPTTESGGRIHTSTATVAVLPEAEEVEVEIDPGDLEIDTFTASGPGGQHVNKTESAVRIVHKPTGLVVTCQDEKSQHKNKARALKVLRARLLDLYEREQSRELAEARRAQVGTGDRSERIRTYNFPQNRVTDHRLGLTLHRLEAVLDGDLEEIIQNLAAHERAGALTGAS